MARGAEPVPLHPPTQLGDAALPASQVEVVQLAAGAPEAGHVDPGVPFVAAQRPPGKGGSDLTGAKSSAARREKRLVRPQGVQDLLGRRTLGAGLRHIQAASCGEVAAFPAAEF